MQYQLFGLQKQKLAAEQKATDAKMKEMEVDAQVKKAQIEWLLKQSKVSDFLMGQVAQMGLGGEQPPALAPTPQPSGITEQDIQPQSAPSPGPLQPLIQQSAAKYGLDPSLIEAVMQAESGGRTDAVSPKGAIGPMQLMPETAKELGVDPYDPAQNIEGGTRYLAQLLKQFGGNTQLALAAYNAGPGAVQQYGGIPPFRETIGYVGKVMGRLGPGRAEAGEPQPSAPGKRLKRELDVSLGKEGPRLGLKISERETETSPGLLDPLTSSMTGGQYPRFADAPATIQSMVLKADEERERRSKQPMMTDTVAQEVFALTGKDPRQAGPEDVGRAIASVRKRQLDERRDLMQEQVELITGAINIREGERPIEREEREQLVGLANLARITKTIQSQFSPEERQRFVGLSGARLTASKVQELLSDAGLMAKNPRFAEFLALNAQMYQEAFLMGGKQLTGMEKTVVEQWIPTGKELSLEQYEEKLNLTAQRIPDIIRQRSQLASTSRKELPQAMERIMDQPYDLPPVTGGTPAKPSSKAPVTHRYNPETGAVEPVAR